MTYLKIIIQKLRRIKIDVRNPGKVLTYHQAERSLRVAGALCNILAVTCENCGLQMKNHIIIGRGMTEYRLSIGQFMNHYGSRNSESAYFDIHTPMVHF
jgi:hypothetical protein